MLPVVQLLPALLQQFSAALDAPDHMRRETVNMESLGISKPDDKTIMQTQMVLQTQNAKNGIKGDSASFYSINAVVASA